MPGDAYQNPIGYYEMPEEITDVTIGKVYKEGKQAFGEGRRRASNPYVERRQPGACRYLVERLGYSARGK